MVCISVVLITAAMVYLLAMIIIMRFTSQFIISKKVTLPWVRLIGSKTKTPWVQESGVAKKKQQPKRLISEGG